MELNQYDIVLVNLDSTLGSEMKKTRPCVVLSPDEMNQFLRTVTIAPMTNSTKEYPTRIEINKPNVRGWLVIDQIRTIDKARVIKKIDKLDLQEIKNTKRVIKETFVD